jgi:hypothetical protein
LGPWVSDDARVTLYAEDELDLEPRLRELHERVDRGAYRPQPSRRTYIPKADGKQRPLAIAALEDKIVQGATVMVLNAIYEGDFVGFSYEFRPGRGPHDPLDVLTVAITTRKVNWILDADVQNFFGSVSQDWPAKLLICLAVEGHSSTLIRSGRPNSSAKSTKRRQWQARLDKLVYLRHH